MLFHDSLIMTSITEQLTVLCVCFFSILHNHQLDSFFRRIFNRMVKLIFAGFFVALAFCGCLPQSANDLLRMQQRKKLPPVQNRD